MTVVRGIIAFVVFIIGMIISIPLVVISGIVLAASLIIGLLFFSIATLVCPNSDIFKSIDFAIAKQITK